MLNYEFTESVCICIRTCFGIHLGERVCVFGPLAPVGLCGVQISVFLFLHTFRQSLCYFYLLEKT